MPPSGSPVNLNKFSSETAIGIITCNRPDFVNQLIDSIDESVGTIFLIDSSDVKTSIRDSFKLKEHIMTESRPTPVGRAKNQLLRKMRHAGFKYLFLIEDDVKILDNSVFEKYILTAAESGLWAGQLSYGSHGGIKGGNVKKDGTPNVREVVEYEQYSIDLYPQSFQAFTLYHANIFKLMGYFDDYYINAVEHLDHYYLAALRGLGNYFWYFPDIKDSWKYITDIDTDHSGSVIRKDPEWMSNVKRATAWFAKKYGYPPVMVPQVSKESVIKRLDFLEENYARKDLL